MAGARSPGHTQGGREPRCPSTGGRVGVLAVPHLLLISSSVCTSGEQTWVNYNLKFLTYSQQWSMYARLWFTCRFVFNHFINSHEPPNSGTRTLTLWPLPRWPLASRTATLG